MKKIKLSFKNTKEVLSRDELKSIVGGFASGGSGGSGDAKCICKCTNHAGSWDSESCESGFSYDCRNDSGEEPGPYTCKEN